MDEGFWETGTKSAIKMTSVRQYKQGLKLTEQIKKFAQARIPHHRRVMLVWEMIDPAL